MHIQRAKTQSKNTKPIVFNNHAFTELVQANTPEARLVSYGGLGVPQDGDVGTYIRIYTHSSV